MGGVLIELTDAQRTERLGKNPVGMTEFCDETGRVMAKYPQTVKNVPFGGDAVKTLNTDCDVIGRLCLATGRLNRLALDTLLDRSARRYVVCSAVVQSMKLQRDDPFVDAGQKPDFHRALDRLEAIEKKWRDRVVQTKDQTATARTESKDEVQRLQQELLAMKQENLRLAKKLEEVLPPTPPTTSGGTGLPAHRTRKR